MIGRSSGFGHERREVDVGKSHVWREDPVRPIPPEITAVAGLDDFHGERVGEEATDALLADDLVNVHNAPLDQAFVERRLPGAAGLSLACSCREVDRSAAELDGRGLGSLAARAGWFFAAH